jgi:hypothetical protein
MTGLQKEEVDLG